MDETGEPKVLSQKSAEATAALIRRMSKDCDKAGNQQELEEVYAVVGERILAQPDRAELYAKTFDTYAASLNRKTSAIVVHAAWLALIEPAVVQALMETIENVTLEDIQIAIEQLAMRSTDEVLKSLKEMVYGWDSVDTDASGMNDRQAGGNFPDLHLL